MTVKFTEEDAAVLQSLARVDKLGADGAKLILLSPVASLVLAMDNPAEFTVSLVQSDFSSIAQGAKNIAKAAACTGFAIVSQHIDAGDPPPVGDALLYFQQLSDSLYARCQMNK